MSGHDSADGGVGAVGRLLSVREVAVFVGVSVRTVYRMIADGQLPEPIKIRGCSRLAVSDVTAFVERAKLERSRRRA